MNPWFDDPTLQEFARVHLRYEVVHLHGTASHLEVLAAGRDQLPETSEVDAYLESFLVHARLLDDFFGMSRDVRDTPLEDSGRRDDVLACDYNPDWVQQRVLSSSIRRSINAQVQHLSVRRKLKRDWHFTKIDASLSKAFDSFLSLLEGHSVDSVRARADYFPEDEEFVAARLPRVPSLLTATTSSTQVSITFRDFRNLHRRSP